MSPHSGNVTALLADWSSGDQRALDALLPLVYAELHRMAEQHLRRERGAHTLQPTALVHEAYLRLVDQEDVTWEGRAHFFAVSARIMRNILVDHARRRLAGKRGGGAETITLDANAEWAQPRVDVVAVDDALNALAAVDEQQARVVELRFFGGLSIEETAAALGVSPTTVKREWKMARAWLLRELGGD